MGAQVPRSTRSPFSSSRWPKAMLLWSAFTVLMVGYVLVFNLIVGTGALALPKAFRHAGYILAIVLLLVSCFMSYVCATFVIEGMAIANAAGRSSQLKCRKKGEATKKELAAIYNIDNRVEVSSMANLFMGKYGVMILTLIMAIYLFGDLAIYTVTVPKSLMNVICWPTWSNRVAIYRICIAGFMIFVTPLVIIGVTRTKYLQVSTSVCRWTAFILMIILASIRLGVKGSPSIPEPVIASGFGSLFGTTVYAFMCHHSLPSLITPMSNKRHIMWGVLMVYICVLLFYVALAMTGAFAFEDIYDVYPLNFLHDAYFQTIFYKICDYFLALFPVFTITSNYPIVGCTLINNLLVFLDICEEMLAEKGITFFRSNKVASSTSEPIARKFETGEENVENKAVVDMQKEESKETEHRESSEKGSSDSDIEMTVKGKDGEESETEEERIRRKTLEQEDHVRKATLAEPPQAKPRLIRRYIVMAILLGLALLIAMLTDNVLILAEITGSYPGVGVQCVIPSLIVIFGRRYSIRELGTPVPRSSMSPFSHVFWPFAMLVWSVFTIVMVSLNFANVFE
ncbi:unnamed protein product [Toxocara canis]|uniref:Aa_trans domain-containing protein n=1 Tax=Toxocara canis TaxID=6265 RepID=A0A183V2U2_TOXCA|nr:unnamed protein product [Toxocara canis]